ncbi:hypothetical protein DY000_02053859 [Brassica cretica]|uniref:AP2/ERF domain-containing protein n=1 Tax=Brassica cretica TaxID=69181 RepID=A0ABQ7AI01_BRACR|nr:hypothetical protein DY000_02053859 [Brassica cretica]
MLIVDRTLLPFFPSSSLVWAVFELGEGSAFLSLGLLLRGLNDLLRPRAQIDPEVSHSQRYTMSFNDASKPFSAPTWGIRAGSGLQGPLILANPHQSGTTIVARPQRIKMGMRHKAGMGMRKPEEQSKFCFSRRGKPHKPGTWVITPTPAPSKPVSDFLQK